MHKSTQYSQQTEPKQCKSDLEPVTITWNSAFHARKNPKQQCLKAVT